MRAGTAVHGVKSGTSLCSHGPDPGSCLEPTLLGRLLDQVGGLRWVAILSLVGHDGDDSSEGLRNDVGEVLRLAEGGEEITISRTMLSVPVTRSAASPVPGT